MADPSTSPPLTRASVAAAHVKIKQYIHETPLLTCKTLDEIASHPDPWSFLSPDNPPVSSSSASDEEKKRQTPKFRLYFKCENQQKIGAFKARGAHHALLRLIDSSSLEAVRSRGGVITHSSGNHAQALALAARTLGVPAHIVMPAISTPSKIAGTKKYTDHVYFSGSTEKERVAKVHEVVESQRGDGKQDGGPVLVPPYDHPDIILGQGTAALEMETQFHSINPNRSLDAVLTPLGGGGLLAGTAIHFSEPSPLPLMKPGKKTLVFGSEPTFQGANDAQIGLSRTPPQRIPHVSTLTVADGLRTPVGELNWTIVSDKALVEGVYAVDEHEILAATKLLLERLKVVVEPSAAVPLAVVLFDTGFRDMVVRKQAERQEQEDDYYWNVGIVLSGGNTTVEALVKLFGDSEKYSRRKVNGDDYAKEREAGLVGLDGRREAEDVAG